MICFFVDDIGFSTDSIGPLLTAYLIVFELTPVVLFSLFFHFCNRSLLPVVKSKKLRLILSANDDDFGLSIIVVWLLLTDVSVVNDGDVVVASEEVTNDDAIGDDIALKSEIKTINIWLHIDVTYRHTRLLYLIFVVKYDFFHSFYRCRRCLPASWQLLTIVD